MTLPYSFDAALPRVRRDLPVSSWIHARGVGGPFGITASVADFAEVIDWQEKRRALTQGYYRLIHPPRVQEFQARVEAKYPGRKAVLFASGRLALKEYNEFARIRGLPGVAAPIEGLPERLEGGEAVLSLHGRGGVRAGVVVLADAAAAQELHERNRRRGGSLSARNVAALLEEPDATAERAGALEECARLLCGLEHAEHALFYPSGMGAVTAVLDQVLTPERPRMLVLGNVYRDTHLLLEEQAWAGRGVRCDFLGTHELEALRGRIHDPDVAGVFVETITNPLIEIPDLPAIAALCRSAGVPLLVDGTMAGPLNAFPLHLGADLVLHSTSKYLSGSNTHGGGVVLTHDPARADSLRAQQDLWDNHLSPLEFPPLLEGLRTYPERLPRFNRNAETLAAFLRGHPAVARVWYGNDGRPAWLHGLGGVVSLLLRDDSLDAVARFFNSPLPGVVKAPSLGSDQTLFCPYVLLAYYDKTTEYLDACHLPRHLLRFAVGSEPDFQPLLEGIGRALDSL